MPVRDLAQHSLNAHAAKTEPRQPYERAFWLIENGKSDKNEHILPVAYAMEIRREPFECDILDAWLLSRAQDSDVEKWLKIPAATVAAYRHLFFDVTAFRDELDVLSWVRKVEAARDENDYGVSLFKTAVTTGMDALIWLFGRGENTVDPQRVMEQILADSHFRGRSHRDHRLTSKEAQAAHNFMNTAFKTAQTLSKRGAPNLNSLAIKLQYRDMTTPVEEATSTEEFLH